MPLQTTALKARDGLLTLSGYGIRISVDRRHLVVEDGVGRDRRRGALHRATARLKRLVVISGAGYISFDAVRWLADVGATYVQIDPGGSLITSYAPAGANDAALRRAQALATTNDVGLRIAKRLITDKVDAQLRLLAAGDRVTESTMRNLVEARSNIAQTTNADELRWCEATAAAAYWNALAVTPIRFVRAELKRVPEHWLVSGGRYSPITNRAAKAVTPAAAMTNYLYAILEAETRVALLATGLDPDVPMLHSLQRFRSSFALDVMEPVRPAVDQFVLDLVATRVFSPRDFVESREGACRLAPDLAKVLANTAARWATLVRPVVAWVATELRRPGPAPRAKALTGPTRFPGALHRRTPNGSLPDAPVAPMARCEDCGRSMSRARYAKCATCERARQALRVPTLGGAQALAEMRAAGVDPAHGGAAGHKRSAIASSRHAEAMAATGRERITADEREQFKQDVLPQLTEISVGALARATSLSKTYCSFIKRGLRVPHPRHWESLVAAANTVAQATLG